MIDAIEKNRSIIAIFKKYAWSSSFRRRFNNYKSFQEFFIFMPLVLYTCVITIVLKFERNYLPGLRLAFLFFLIITDSCNYVMPVLKLDCGRSSSADFHRNSYIVGAVSTMPGA